MFKTVLKKLVGSKADRDLKTLNPVLAQTLKAYETIKELSTDELRAKTDEFKARITEYIQPETDQIVELKLQIENDPDMDVDHKEKIYEEIDKLETASYEKTQEVLNQILPEAFSVMKETARRFKENETVEIGRASCRERV